MRAAGYVRVSTADQATNGLSLQAQRDLLTRYARDHGHELVRIYADEGISASKSLEKREELLRMVRDAEAGKFDVILFKDITRWSRNAAQYYKVQERLDKAKVGWIAVEQPYLETVTPTGKFQVSIMLGTSQLEADQTAQRVKSVQNAEVARGFFPFPAHCAPFGFTTEKRGGHNHLVVNPDEIEIIRDIFETFLATGNLTRTAEMLYAKYGINKIPSNLARTIKNTLYIGKFRGVQYIDPVIPVEMFENAQKVGKHHTNVSKWDYIFSGMCYCGICGDKMHWNAPSGYKMCRCLNHFNTITEKEMERKVIEQVEPELNKYRIEIAKKPPKGRSQKRLDEKLKRLTEVYVDGLISREDFERRKKDMESLAREVEEQTAPELPINWKQIYMELTPAQKNVLWKTTVDRFVIKDKSVTIAFETAQVLAERMAIIEDIASDEA